MIEELSIIRSAISGVVRFPVRSHTIFGGNPFSMAISKKSASKVTNVNPFCLAKSHISTSLQLRRPTERRWQQLEKFSGNNRKIRYEMFWSNNNFISNILQSSFSLRCKCKAGKNILHGQLWKIRKYFAVGHACRQPSQYIVNGNSSLSDTRFSKAFLRINSDNIVIISHNNLFIKITARKYNN